MAAVAPRPARRVYLPPRIDEDTTVRHIADILSSSARFQRTSEDFDSEAEGLYHYLHPYGIKRPAIKMALRLTHKEGGGRRGTAHVPNARLHEHKATLTGEVRAVRDHEVYFRAAYLANAAHRMQTAMDAGATQQDALRREAPYYRSHEAARRGRLRAVAQVQTAAKTQGWETPRGTLVGWYLNPLKANEAECIAANGHNFYAEEGTVIGLPGSVHNQCGCYAGTPHWGARMVNDVFHGIVKLERKRAVPKFKLKEKSA